MRPQKKELLIATQNHHKVQEIQAILKDLPVVFRLLSEYTDLPEVVESGGSFEENALLKARSFCEACGIAVIAEDSGLVIPALNGEPGIYSARYGSKDGERVDDALLIQRVLEKMCNVPLESRNAQFVSVCVLMVNTQQSCSARGVLEGRIHFEALGHDGFGYDPIFFLPEAQKTLAQLSFEEKNAASHRMRALRSLRKTCLPKLFE